MIFDITKAAALAKKEKYLKVKAAYYRMKANRIEEQLQNTTVALDRQFELQSPSQQQYFTRENI